MKNIIVSLVLSIFLLTGFANSTNNVVAREYVKPVMEGEIIIATMFKNHLLEEAAELFMEKYPDVTVTINTGLDTNDFTIISKGEDENGSFVYAETDMDAYMVAMENYLTQLNIRLMNGSAEDILLTSDLPVQNYINMGVFEDLTFYLDNSPDINDDNHFMNVIYAFKDDNSQVWQMPISFDMHRMVYFNRQLVDESGLSIGENVNSMTYEEALDFGISILEYTDREDAYLSLSLHSTAYSLIEGRITEFISIKDKEVNLDSDEFISLLEEIKELNNGEYFPIIDEDFINFSWFDKYYAVDMAWGLGYTAYMSLSEDSEMYSVLPMSDSIGNINLVSYNTLAINSASENKDISWEFIKFLLSDEMQASFHQFPVNRSLYEGSLQIMLESYSNSNETETDVELDELDELIQGWISQINNYKSYDSNISNIFFEELDKFIEGEQSAEETAQVLQSRVNRYIQETF